MRHPEEQLQIFEETLIDHLVSRDAVLKEQPLKNFPNSRHYLLDDLAVDFVICLGEGQRGHLMNLMMHLRQALIVYQGLLEILRNQTYSNAFLSGENADALIDTHLMLQLP